MPLVRVRSLDVDLDVDERRLAGDRDRLGELAELHGHVQRERLLQGHADVVPDQGLEAVQGERDPIDAGHQVEQAEDAVRVRDGRGLSDELGARGLDRHSRQDAAVRVGDGPDDAGVGHLAVSRHEGQGQAQHEGQNTFAHVSSSSRN